MRSLRARLEALEAAAKRGSGNRQLDLFIAALSADPAATVEFENLRGRVTGKLHELLDAIRIPLEAEGEWPARVRQIDIQRPTDGI